MSFSEAQWQHFRMAVAIVAGLLTLVLGVTRDEPSLMTVGAGLIGFSPAAKGP